MKRIISLLIVLQAFTTWSVSISAQNRDESPEVVAARHARDHASVDELRAIIAKAQREAAETNSLDAYLRLALLEVWMCEAAESHQDNALFKQAAEAGVAAAERAVQLNPQSSDAHQLLGDCSAS